MTLNIAIVVGSTRPGRKAETVARWVLEHASARTGASYELVDLALHVLPMLDEELPAHSGQYSHHHTKAWAAVIDRFDGFVFVTPEYNRGTSAALKNAIDYLYGEWNDKAAGFVSYGYVGGTRAVEQLRLTMSELQVAVVRTQVALMFHGDFQDMDRFTPGPHHANSLADMLGQVEAWSGALRQLRAPVPQGDVDLPAAPAMSAT